MPAKKTTAKTAPPKKSRTLAARTRVPLPPADERRGTDERDLLAAQREHEALELRKLGMGFAEIARQVGYADRSGAYYAVQRALANLVTPKAEELRKLEAERLEDLLKVIYAKALTGDNWSVDRVLALMERKAKLLGLDLPTSANLNLSVPGIREYPEGIAEGV